MCEAMKTAHAESTRSDEKASARPAECAKR